MNRTRQTNKTGRASLLLGSGAEIAWQHARRRDRRTRFLLWGLGIFYVSCLFLSALMGRYVLTPREILIACGEVLRGLPQKERSLPAEVYTVFFSIRLPRLLLASLVGLALSAAGCAFQSLFRNPMVSPDILGASSGAAFFASLSILLSLPRILLMTHSFFGGLLSVFLVSVLSARLRFDRLLGLILTGMIVSSLFGAALSLLKYLADPTDQLPAITYWLMGSFGGADRSALLFAAPPILLASAFLYGLRFRLNIMSFGESTAQSLGLSLRRSRAMVLFAATLLTASSVAVSGMISWVGLVIPHFAKLLVGADQRSAYPASLLMGASFMLIVDDASRLLTTAEIPLGILTAFIGAPVFLFLIFRESRKRR